MEKSKPYFDGFLIAIMLLNKQVTHATHMHNVRNEHYSYDISSPYTRKTILSGSGSNKTKINDICAPMLLL